MNPLQDLDTRRAFLERGELPPPSLLSSPHSDLITFWSLNYSRSHPSRLPWSQVLGFLPPLPPPTPFLLVIMVTVCRTRLRKCHHPSRAWAHYQQHLKSLSGPEVAMPILPIEVQKQAARCWALALGPQQGRRDAHLQPSLDGSRLSFCYQVLLSAKCPQLGCKLGGGGRECGAPSDGYCSGTPGKGPHWLQSGDSCRGTPKRDLKWTFPPTSALRAGLFLLECWRCANSHCENPQPGS